MRSLITRFFAPVVMVAILAGCGGSSEQAPAEEAASEPIVIEANDAMQFSVTEFTVEAGSEVTITLQNVGSLPKETFGHNLVILDNGTDVSAFANAATAAADNAYIPADMEELMVAHTELLGPGEEDTITFTAPTEPGRYDYICTFPGHWAAMRGVMIVE